MDIRGTGCQKNVQIRVPNNATAFCGPEEYDCSEMPLCNN